MTKINVELVKYDTEKTTKRKRANLEVEYKSENAVIERLERIHKGDRIKTIHEIVWGEEVKEEEAQAELFVGHVKFFEEEKGFGFIEPEEDIDDLFFHASALGGACLFKDDFVEFEISESAKGPVAIRIKRITEEDSFN